MLTTFPHLFQCVYEYMNQKPFKNVRILKFIEKHGQSFINVFLLHALCMIVHFILCFLVWWITNSFYGPSGLHTLQSSGYTTYGYLHHHSKNTLAKRLFRL